MRMSRCRLTQNPTIPMPSMPHPMRMHRSVQVDIIMMTRVVHSRFNALPYTRPDGTSDLPSSSIAGNFFPPPEKTLLGRDFGVPSDARIPSAMSSVINRVDRFLVRIICADTRSRHPMSRNLVLPPAVQQARNGRITPVSQTRRTSTSSRTSRSSRTDSSAVMTIVGVRWVVITVGVTVPVKAVGVVVVAVDGVGEFAGGEEEGGVVEFGDGEEVEEAKYKGRRSARR